MMNTKKFVALGLISMFTFTGCFNQNSPVDSKGVEPITSPAVTKSVEEESVAVKEVEDKAEVEAETTTKEAEVKNQTAIKDFIALGQLMGKKQADVIALMGKAEETKNLENTNILLADYYTQTILEQTVRIEIVYNDDKGEVNFINMTCKQTDDVEGFVEAFAKELTAEFGESSIEKITNVRGTKRRQWQDSTLTYVLSYVEDTVTLDMYLTDK